MCSARSLHPGTVRASWVRPPKFQAIIIIVVEFQLMLESADDSIVSNKNLNSFTPKMVGDFRDFVANKTKRLRKINNVPGVQVWNMDFCLKKHVKW